MKRSLQTRLALVYAAGVYLAGVVVLAFVLVPLAGVRSAVPGPEGGSVAADGTGLGPGQLVVATVVGLVVLVPVSIVTGWFVAGRFLRPLGVVTATAAVISAGNLDRRLDLGEPFDELTELGAILDDLFARLQASFDAQKHFVANASHELRTPLAGQRTLLEVALADPSADIQSLRAACEEALTLGEHQERLLQALLALATSERGLTRREPVDLAEVARSALGGRAAEITVLANLNPAVITGDPKLVESLIANLIANALRHNHPGGRVEVTTAGQTLTVVNTGPHVPEAELERLLQPFQKVERGGYGLGLAIVDAIARAHHATLTTTPNPEGGLTVTVQFPASSGELLRRSAAGAGSD